MTTTLLLTVALIALLMFVMGLGVMLSGRELQGSCGGVGSSCACDDAGIPRECDLVPGPGEPRRQPEPPTGCSNPQAFAQREG